MHLRHVNISKPIILKCDTMTESIYQNPNKAKGRSKSEIFKDCLLGLTLESYAASFFNLNLNTCPEDYRYSGTYDHDLVCPITNERYEVKQSKLVESKGYGKTLVFHKSIYEIAKDPKRYFHWFIFGESISVKPIDMIGSIYLYAIVPRQAIIEFSKPSNHGENYMYFQDVLSNNNGYKSTILFKN